MHTGHPRPVKRKPVRQRTHHGKQCVRSTTHPPRTTATRPDSAQAIPASGICPPLRVARCAGVYTGCHRPSSAPFSTRAAYRTESSDFSLSGGIAMPRWKSRTGRHGKVTAALRGSRGLLSVFVPPRPIGNKKGNSPTPPVGNDWVTAGMAGKGAGVAPIRRPWVTTPRFCYPICYPNAQKRSRG